MKFAILVPLSIILTAICILIMKALARIWNLERSNFKGKRIPAGFGFVIALVTVPIYVGMLLYSKDSQSWAFLALILGFGVLGLLDDISGNRSVGGFKGHLGLLKHGKVSTGLIKAVAGGLLSLAVGLAISGFRLLPGILNGFIIALSANTINLLDLRPGRAVSLYWVGTIILLASKLAQVSVLEELVPVFVPALWLTAKDRSASIMLGDAGSNTLGAVLGLAFAYELGYAAKIIIIICLAGINFYSERHSISKLIENNRLLNRIDRLLGER